MEHLEAIYDAERAQQKKEDKLRHEVFLGSKRIAELRGEQWPD